MRKPIVAVVFILIGLILIPQVFTQDASRLNELTKQMEQLMKDFQAGKITAQQFQQQTSVVKQGIQAMEQGVEAERKRLIQNAPSFTDAEMRKQLDLLDRSKKITAQYNERRITEAEAARQNEQIQNEINQIYAPYKNLEKDKLVNIAVQQAELEKQLEALWPGSTPGWPPATVPNDNSYLALGGLSRPLHQAAGTRASYSVIRLMFNGDIREYRIYQTGANRAAFDDLRRQIESIIGKQFTGKKSDTVYQIFVLKEVLPDGTHYYYNHAISFKDGTLRYSVSDTAHDMGSGSTRKD